MPSLFPDLFAWSFFVPTVLRLVLGFVSISYGFAKFKNFPETVEFLNAYKIRPAKFWAYTVAIGEILSGALLIVGFLTQLASFVIAVIMLVSILKIKGKKGLIGGYDFELLVLAISLAIIFLGPGAFSIDLPL